MEHAFPVRLPSRCWSLVPVLAALLASAWLLATRFLSGYAADVLTGLQWDAFAWLAVPVFLWVVVLSAVHILCVPASARRVAVLPLAVCLLAGAFYVAPAPIIDDLDFQRHYTTRMEVMQRIESGELWNGSPFNTLVSLPWPEYPTSVSNGGGWRDVTVYREEGALHVVFHPVKGGLFDWTAFVYRSDGDVPVFPERVVPNAVSSERLDDHWHRVLFAGPTAVSYAALLLVTILLTLATGVVLVPLALGMHRLAHRSEVVLQ